MFTASYIIYISFYYVESKFFFSLKYVNEFILIFSSIELNASYSYDSFNIIIDASVQDYNAT